MDIENKWHEAFEGCGNEFRKAVPDYEKLDKRTQIIGALFLLERDINNGGYSQFYRNWGHKAATLANEGLEQMGLVSKKDWVMESFSIIEKYDNGEVDLWGIEMTHEEIATIRELSMKYWRDGGIMEDMLRHFSKQ